VIEQGIEMGRPSTLESCACGSLERLARIEVGGSNVLLARGELFLP
jgi:predicted PhzF superfamily epimerase YddE/YHI9